VVAACNASFAGSLFFQPSSSSLGTFGLGTHEGAQSYRGLFCGNDAINNFDVNGNSWLSKLWDHTILKIGQQTAINWDHSGRQAAEVVAVIVASVVTYGAADGWLAGALAPSVAAGSISAGEAATIAAFGAGGAAGFVGSTMGATFAGDNLGQAVDAGLKGGAIAAVTAGLTEGLSSGGLGGNLGIDQDISRFATGALRGAIETGNIGGALRGGLVNEVPTDLGVGSSYYNNPYVNFAVNEVRDAGQGYAINGRVGAERSVFGSLANDAVGHLLGLVSSDFSAPTFKGGVYMYPITSGIGKWLQSNFYGAITFGNVVTGPQSMINAPIGAYSYGNGFGTPESAFGTDPAWTSAHEIDHFESQNILGAYYLPLQALSQAAGFFPGGRDAFLEQYPFKDLPYGR